MKEFKMLLAEPTPLLTLRKIFVGCIRYRARKAAEGCVIRASEKEAMAGEVLASRQAIDKLVNYANRCIRTGETIRSDVVLAIIQPKFLGIFSGDDVTLSGMKGIIENARGKWAGGSE